MPRPTRHPTSSNPPTFAAIPQKEGAAELAGHPTVAEWPFSPVCCAPDAFALMHQQTMPVTSQTTTKPRQRAQRRLDTDEGLLAASCAVALHALPKTEPADCTDQLEALANEVRQLWGRKRGMKNDTAIARAFAQRTADSPQTVMAYLHEVVFGKTGFSGNGGDYYNAGNSFLPKVLETRRGLPISLSLVYKLVAGRLGLRCWGVGLPGHFLVGLDCHGPVLVDCFHAGRLLDADDAAERVHACAGPETRFSDDMLRPVTHRHWVTRLIQNLLQSYTSAGRYTDVAAMLELELLLWPEQLHLQRDLGLVLARLGQPRPAAIWLGRYLACRPDDPQRGDLEELLGVLG